MKICFISTFYGANLGGAEISTHLLKEGLVEKGIEVVVLSTRRTRGAIYIPHSKFIPAKLLLIGNPVVDYFLYLQIKKILKQYQPDVVHTHDLYCLPAALKASEERHTPLIQTIRDPLPKKLSTKRNLFIDMTANYFLNLRNKKWIECLHKVDKIIAISKFIENSLLNLGIAKAKISQIYNLPQKTAASKNNFDKNSQTTILSASRLHEEKGVDVLIRAVASLGERKINLKLIIAGDGPEKHKLVRLVEQHNISDLVEFKGNLPSNEMSKLYSLADIVVLPSRYPEPLGRTILDAMAFGKVVIASRTGGIPELIEDNKTGLLFEPNNHKQLAQKIEVIIKNKDLQKRIGNKAREQLSKKFNPQDIIGQHLEIYNELIKNE